jgi:hypothetical protein
LPDPDERRLSVELESAERDAGMRDHLRHG